MKHLRSTLSGELPRMSPSSYAAPSPRPTIFKRRLMRRRVVDVPPPIDQTLREMNRIVDERFGLALCPECGFKVAVLVGGICRECGPNEVA